MIKQIAVGGCVIALLSLSLINIKNKDTKTNYKNELPMIQDLVDREVKILEQEKRLEQIEKAKVEKRKKRKLNTTSRGTFRTVPQTDTSMKSYMDYRCITNKDSDQYKLQHSKDIYTDSEGFRKIGDKFIIAVGTYFSSKVGQEVVVELSNGQVFKAIVGDIKNNKHTDSTNRQHKVDGSVIEFIVDTNKLPNLVKKMGNTSYAEKANLQGNIISIKVLENDN